MEKEKKYVLTAVVVLILVILYFANLLIGKMYAAGTHSIIASQCEQAIKMGLEEKEKNEKFVKDLQNDTSEDSKAALRIAKWYLPMGYELTRDINYLCYKENILYNQKIDSLNYFDMEDALTTSMGLLNVEDIVVYLDGRIILRVDKEIDKAERKIPPKEILPSKFDSNVLYASKIDLEKINYRKICEKEFVLSHVQSLDTFLKDPYGTITVMRIRPAIHSKCEKFLKEYAYYSRSQMEDSDPYVKVLNALKISHLKQFGDEIETFQHY